MSYNHADVVTVLLDVAKKAVTTVNESTVTLDIDDLLILLYKENPWRGSWFVCKRWYALLRPLPIEWYALSMEKWKREFDASKSMSSGQAKPASVFYDKMAEMGVPQRLLDDLALFGDSVAISRCTTGSDMLLEFLNKNLADRSKVPVTTPLPLHLLNHHARDLRVCKYQSWSDELKLIQFDVAAGRYVPKTTGYVSYGGSVAWKCSQVVEQLSTMTTATQPQHYTSENDQKRLASDITAYYGNDQSHKILLNRGFSQYEKEWVVARGLRAYRTKWIIYNDDQTLVGSPFVLYEYTTVDKEGQVVAAMSGDGNTSNGQNDKKKHLILMNHPGVSRQCIAMHNQYKLMALLHRYILESFYGVVIDATWLLCLGERVGGEEQYEVVEVAPSDQLLAMALTVIQDQAVPKPQKIPLITKYEQFIRDRDVYADLQDDMYKYHGNEYGVSSSSSCTLL